MKAITMFVVAGAFILATAGRLSKQIKALNNQRVDIDLLGSLLDQVRPRLGKKVEIVFDSNCQGGEREVLYYQSEFAIAPRVLVRNEKPEQVDSVLTIEKNYIKDTVQLQNFQKI